MKGYCPTCKLPSKGNTLCLRCIIKSDIRYYEWMKRHHPTKLSQKDQQRLYNLRYRLDNLPG